MPKYRIGFGEPHYGATNPSEYTEWKVRLIHQMKMDPRIEGIIPLFKNDTPTDMVRNDIIEESKANKCDLLLMTDNDVWPDMRLGSDVHAKPFWETSFEFMINHGSPCIIAAPYVGPPTDECVYAFKCEDITSRHHPDELSFKLSMYGRDEAARLGGIQRAAALATGLILIDMRVFDVMEPDYFYYEYTDKFRRAKASTEDVTFTRDAALLGIPLYVNWDAWCGHQKKHWQDKPAILPIEAVGEKYRKAVEKKQSALESVKEIKVNEDRLFALQRQARNNLAPPSNGKMMPVKIVTEE